MKTENKRGKRKTENGNFPQHANSSVAASCRLADSFHCQQMSPEFFGFRLPPAACRFCL
jgi:hypothetical protein